MTPKSAILIGKLLLTAGAVLFLTGFLGLKRVLPSQQEGAGFLWIVSFLLLSVSGVLTLVWGSVRAIEEGE